MGQILRDSIRSIDEEAIMYITARISGLSGAFSRDASKIIVNAVTANMRVGLRIWPGKAIELANTQIDTAQRFYVVELDKAAEALTRSFPLEKAPYGTDESTWRMLIRNKMNWRTVSIKACKPGLEVDPVSRKCVEKYIPTPATILPPVPPVPEPEEAGILGGSGMMLMAAAAVVGFMIFRK